MNRYILRHERVRQSLYKELSMLPLDGTFAVTIERAEDIRTDAQNRRYFAGVVTAIQAHIQHQEGRHVDKERIHDWLKSEYFGMDVESIGGTVKMVPKRSRKLGKREFGEYAEWAESYAMDKLGVPPDMIAGYAEEAA